MPTHTMNLRGFWKATELPDGRVSFTRHFGKPRTLDADESLWIVLGIVGQVSVNGVSLGEGTHFDVTACLEPRNLVEVIPPPGATLTEAVLEVRSADHSS
jgi:hypothetical protein